MAISVSKVYFLSGLLLVPGMACSFHSQYCLCSLCYFWTGCNLQVMFEDFLCQWTRPIISVSSIVCKFCLLQILPDVIKIYFGPVVTLSLKTIMVHPLDYTSPVTIQKVERLKVKCYYLISLVYISVPFKYWTNQDQNLFCDIKGKVPFVLKQF